MTSLKLNAYAIFVDDEYAATTFVPYERDEWSVKMTAALKSNPTIVLDPETDLSGTYRYSIFVDGEYVDKLYQNIEPSFFHPINAALQSNPRVVWIETDYDVQPGMSWTYENDTFTING